MSVYQKKIRDEEVDVYDILKAYDVRCPARQHAIKKLLLPGGRHAKDALQDLQEAHWSIGRSITMLLDDQEE